MPFMLDVRSTTSMRSTGDVGLAPHGPLQAAEMTVWLVPDPRPSAGPKRYGTVTSPSMTTVLQMSPSAGTQGDWQIVELQVQSALGPGSQTAGTSDRRGAPPALPMTQRNPTDTPGGSPPG